MKHIHRAWLVVRVWYWTKAANFWERRAARAHSSYDRSLAVPTMSLRQMWMADRVIFYEGKWFSACDRLKALGQ
jgi:hypothetical protein